MKTARLRAMRALALGLVTSLSMPIVGLAFTPVAHAESPQEEASNRYKKGVDLYKEGDYRAALIEFKRAYELSPNFAVLYNMGQVYFQLQDYVGALAALEQYLNDGGAQVPAARRAEVQKDIDKLKSRIARIEIVTNVSDGEVSIDDVGIGKSPLPKPVMVSAGRRKITVSKPGLTPVSKMVDVAGADNLRVSIDLTETTSGTPPPLTGTPPASETQPPPDTNTPPNASASADSSSSAPTVAWIITGLLVAGTATTGILALGASNDLQTQRDEPGASRQSLNDAQSKTQSLALVTDVLGAAALVAGGVSLYLTLSSPSDEPASDAKVGLRVAPTGLLVDGTF